MENGTQLATATSSRMTTTFRSPESSGSVDSDGSGIAIRNGQLFVGGELVADAHFSHNRVTWAHRSGTKFSNGVMYFEDKDKPLYTVVDSGEIKDRGPRTTSPIAAFDHSAASVNGLKAAPQAEPLQLSGLFRHLPDEQVSRHTQELFQESMRWALGQSERTREWQSFMGAKTPAIDKEQEAIIRKSMWWYTEVYAQAVITHSLQSFAGDGAPKLTLDDAQALALKQFLEPGAGLSLSSSSHYAIQNKELYMLAYRKRNKELLAYVNDRSVDWAAELERWLENEQFVGLIKVSAAQTGSSDCMTAINNWTTLLEVLQPSGERARRFHLKALAAYEAQVHINFTRDITKLDKDTVQAWLPDVLRTVLLSIANGSLKIDGMTAAQAQELQNTAMDKTTEVLSSFGTFLTTLETAHFNIQSVRFNEAFRETFQRRFPKFAYAGSIVVPIAAIMGFASVAMILWSKGWEKLTPKEKSDVVVQLAQNVISLPMVWRSGTTYVQMTKEGICDFRIWFRRQRGLDVSEFDSLLYNRTRDMKMMRYGTVQLEEFGIVKSAPPPARWGHLMQDGNKAAATLKIATVALSWVTVGLSAWKIQTDVMNGESTNIIAMDSVVLATGILGAVFLTADLFIATALLPWLALACAVIGAIFSIVEALLPHMTPIDHFMDYFGLPFSKGLLENGKTNWIFDDSTEDGDGVNSIDLTNERLFCILVRFDADYGIVNLRFLRGTSAGKVQTIFPKTSYKNGSEDGWLTPDHSGEVAWTTTPTTPDGEIGGLWLAKDHAKGIVNLRISRDNTLNWDDWETPYQNENNAETTSQPRICKKILKIWTRRQDGYGIVDARFEYKDRLV